MEIQKLRIENFMSIGSAELFLDERGLVLIQGVNNDDTSAHSNGAGKSTIPDAISWCLFGSTARGESGDSIVNQKAGGDTRVQITLHDRESGDHVFVVTRNRKHHFSKNRLTLGRVDADGTKTDLTLGTDRLTQTLIERILGCSEAVFTSAIYAGQERMPDLPSMTDKQLKELLEEAAGISELQKHYDLARERLATVKSECTTRQSQLASAEKAVTQAESFLQDITESHDKWGVDHEAVLAERRKDFGVRYEGITEELLKTRILALRSKAATASKSYLEAKETLSAPDKEAAELQQIAENDARRVVSIEATVKASAAEILKLKTDLDNLDKRIGTPCGECGKPYAEEDLAAARKARTASLRERVSRHKDLQEALSKARISRDTTQSTLERYLSSRPSKGDEQERVLELQRKAFEARDEVTKAERALVDFKKAIEDLEALGKQENPFLDNLAKARSRLADARSKIAPIQDELTAFEGRVQLHQQAVEVFGPAGVRAHILDNVTPYLNARTSQYLSTLSDGNLSATWSTLSTTAKGALRERFVIEVNNDAGGSSFGLLSGGEKRKVRLACALALQDLVSTRASKPFRLFVADEIDDALDSAGLERLMAVLEEKARERGTVLVISHNSLSDWIREVVTVEKVGGQSSVRGPICRSE
jgi:DNA repair exonuclease SbcCD ATPase subunit